MKKKDIIYIPENPISRFLFNDTRSSIFWLIVRLYVGYVWLLAGWHKITDDAWVGSNAGKAVAGYLQGVIVKSQETTDVAGWYAFFIEHIALPNATLFSYLVAFGELFVGLGLIVGLFTGIAAFFGTFMNVAFLFAGTVSSNPLLFILGTWLVLAWKNAGWYGLDRWVLPKLGTPWGSFTYDEKSNN